MRDVTTVIPHGGYDPAAASDRVILDHDKRVRRRIVFTTVGGERIRLCEAEVVQLRHGDGLRLDDGRTVAVEARLEPLLEIEAADAAALVRIAWHLGNRHLPTQLLAGRLRIRADHVIEAMVEALGGRCRSLEAPFDPEGGAYERDHAPANAHAHAHSHAHGE